MRFVKSFLETAVSWIPLQKYFSRALNHLFFPFPPAPGPGKRQHSQPPLQGSQPRGVSCLCQLQVLNKLCLCLALFGNWDALELLSAAWSGVMVAW